MSQAYTGGSLVYEHKGRYFVEAGIGTIGWNVYTMYTETDLGGNSPFATLLTSQDGSTHRWDNFIGCYSTNYGTFGRVLQPIEGVV